ncbi:MAG: ABC transporter ATP-binding protein [Pseudomonas sp.]|nr:ABC transporter ATP-binding protein [Pseudomonas sp.]
MADLKIHNLKKGFDGNEIIKGIDLDIRDREFVVFVGPSGCGKSTLLRLIAGLEEVSSGRIELDGRDITDVSPAKRDLAMVFQTYALYPHMTVRKNMSFALDLAGADKQEVARKIEAAARTLELEPLLERKPRQLSGGQRQRVALARALVNKPKVLLLDEPLGALDLKLREQMQEELKTLQRSLGITFIFVTHDQGEALSMADRVAVFNDGRIVQAGTPEEIYNRPKTRFVADFVGSSNVISPADMKALGGEMKWASLRPEAIRLVTDGGITANVRSTSFLGAATRLTVATANIALTVMVPAGQPVPETGATTRLSWQPTDLHYMDDAA